MNIIGQNGNEGDHYNIEVKDPEEVKNVLSTKVPPKVLKILDKTDRMYKILNDQGDISWQPKAKIDKNKKDYL